jgi:ribosomal protein S18 acetylase RimI-like enzyme
MPLATRHRNDFAPPLAPLPALVVRRETSVAAMAALQGKPEDEVCRRFAEGRRAYVASLDARPVAWGWVATRTAAIGELGSAFRIPDGERYLWNFVTLAAHRGQGIYPRLVDTIVRAESQEAERFWIARAPENHASGAGIRRAGFATVAELSFDAAGRPAVRGIVEGGGALAARLLGIAEAADSLARCWRCVRAGRGAMSCAADACRCDYQHPESGCAA